MLADLEAMRSFAHVRICCAALSLAGCTTSEDPVARREAVVRFLCASSDAAGLTSIRWTNQKGSRQCHDDARSCESVGFSEVLLLSERGHQVDIRSHTEDCAGNRARGGTRLLIDVARESDGGDGVRLLEQEISD